MKLTRVNIMNVLLNFIIIILFKYSLSLYRLLLITGIVLISGG